MSPQNTFLKIHGSNFHRLACVFFVAGTFFVVPVSSQESLTDQLDTHLEQFNEFVSTGVEIESTETDDTPNIVVDPVSESDVKAEIIFEEDSLQQVEVDLRDAEIELWNTVAKKGDIESQIFGLDQELNLIQQQLPVYEEQEDLLREQLGVLTRDKTNIEGLLRVKQREYDRLAVRNFLRNDNWQGRAEPNPTPSSRLFLLRWIFSNRSLSDVIADYQRQESIQRTQQEGLGRLEVLRKQLQVSEKQIAYKYAVATQLANQITRHKKNISDFADAKVELRERVLLTKDQLETRITEFRSEQSESTILLQDLRSQLENPETRVNTVVSGVTSTSFENPLEGELRITAYFQDKAYEREFGIRHDAVDIAAPQGSRVLAIQNGIVSKVKNNGLGYSYLIVEHANDVFSLYGHVSGFLVKEGQTVNQGDVIALSGGTPGTKGAGFFTTGPHLHLEMFKNGKYVNPLLFLPKGE